MCWAELLGFTWTFSVLFVFLTFSNSFEAHIKCIFSFLPLEKNDVESQSFFYPVFQTTKKIHSSQHRNKIKCSRWLQFLWTNDRKNHHFFSFSWSYHEHFMAINSLSLSLQEEKKLSKSQLDKMHRNFIYKNFHSFFSIIIIEIWTPF